MIADRIKGNFGAYDFVELRNMRFFKKHPLVCYLVSFAVLAFGLSVMTAQPWYADHVKEPLARGLTWLVGNGISMCQVPVVRYGKVLMDPVSGFAMEITHACTGLMLSLLYVCAALALPVFWLRRLSGALFGFCFLMAINVIRLFSLYFIGRINQAAFEWAHNTAWDTLILVLATVCYLLWTHRVVRLEYAHASR